MAIKIRAYQFPVNNVGDREEIKTVARCELVEIKELPSITPKQLYKVADVPNGGTAAEVNAGTPFFFTAGKRGQFEAGEIVGYVESNTGATTFQRIEHLTEP